VICYSLLLSVWLVVKHPASGTIVCPPTYTHTHTHIYTQPHKHTNTHTPTYTQSHRDTLLGIHLGIDLKVLGIDLGVLGIIWVLWVYI
jgi:hypothetical protein